MMNWMTSNPWFLFALAMTLLVVAALVINRRGDD